MTDPLSRRGVRSFSASLDIEASAQDAFSLLCAVEKWPVWLSFLRSSRRAISDSPLAIGSEVLVRSTLPAEEEELYEVDQLIGNFQLSFVGAYSTRRRLEFRLEQKTSRARLSVKLSYPAYHGRVGDLVDRWTNGRKVDRALENSLLHFKGLVEYRTRDGVLADL
ncbi:MAG: hypothetical protein M3R51_10115 [Candidatus Eremiobacteraeota bacterium]|nr:hypothetical protein [Candidatus Eremiobacteraeota bacterium]